MGALPIALVKRGEEGPVKINQSDLDDWKKDGWEETAENAPEPVAQPDDGPMIDATMSKADIMDAIEHPMYDAIRDQIDSSLTKREIVDKVSELMAVGGDDD